MNAVKLSAVFAIAALGVLSVMWWIGSDDLVELEGARERRAATTVAPESEDLAAPMIPDVAAFERRAMDAPVPAVDEGIALTVRGRVVDGAETGVSGARVIAANRGSGNGNGIALDADRVHRSGEQPPRFETRSDEQGYFELGGTEPGAIRIAVRASGFAPLDDDDRYLAEGEVLDVGDLVLSPGVVLAGLVVDASGAGVVGASLSLEKEGPGFFASTLRALLAVTGEDGSFSVTLAPGPWKLHIEAEGYPVRVETGLELDPVLRDDMLIRLERQWTIAGRVLPTTETSGADLSAIQVRLKFVRDQVEPPGILNQHRSQSVQCAADGAFRFTTVRSVEDGEPSRYQLHALRVYGNMGRRLSEQVSVQAGDLNVELPLFATSGIDFQLVDGSTGLPISDPRVSLGAGPGNHILVSGGDALRAEGADGRFKIVDVAPIKGAQETWLWVSKEGYFNRVVPGVAFTLGGVTDLGRVALSPAPTARVLVVEAQTGRPVADAEVKLERPDAPWSGLVVNDTTPPSDFLPKHSTATTDADGVARVPAPLDEAAVLHVSHAAYAIHPDLPVLATEVGEVSVTVELEGGGAINVVVSDGLGGPAIGVDVFGQVQGDGPRLQTPRATTNTSGTARFEHLAPTRHEFRLVAPPRAVGEAWHAVDVTAGETRVLNLTAPVEATLEGRITEAGAALAGAELHAVPGAPEDPESHLNQWNTESGPLTNSQGGFALEPLEVGEWTLIITHESRALRDHARVTVARDAPAILIDLDVTEVAGTVASPTGTPFAGESVYGFRALSETSAMRTLLSDRSPDPQQLRQARIGTTTTDSNGRYRLRGVPAGEPILVATIPDGCQPAITARLRIERGAVREGVDLTPVPGGGIDVRLTVPEKAREVLRFYRVKATSNPGSPTPLVERTAAPDSSGLAVLRNLQPGAWMVEVARPFDDEVLAGPMEVTVEAGKQANLAFEIP